HREVGAMAVSEQTIEVPRSRSALRVLRYLVLFAVAVLLGLAAVAGALYVLHDREAGRILPGVSVGGVDVGGRTADEARADLAARHAPLSTGGGVIRPWGGDR